MILKEQKTKRLRHKTKSASIGSKKTGRNALEQVDGFTEIHNGKLLPQTKYWERIKWVTRACKNQTSIIIKECGMITKNKNSNKNRAEPTASKMIN